MRSKLHVTQIKQKGFFETARIQRKNYNKQVTGLFSRFGFTLPNYSWLKKHYKTPQQLRVLLHTLEVWIHLANGDKLYFKFLPGFIWDLASVPKIFRSFIDNDDMDLMLASLLHDFIFSTHALNFSDGNKLFYEVARFKINYNWNRKRRYRIRFKARSAWLAVSSFVGRILWHKNYKRRLEYTLKFSEFKRLYFGGRDWKACDYNDWQGEVD